MRTLASDGIDLAADFAVADDLESVAQRVIQRLRFFRGEFFLDTTAGVPYFRDILTRPTTVGLAVATLTAAIRTVPDVDNVTDANGVIDPRTRTLTFSARVHTRFGATAVSTGV